MRVFAAGLLAAMPLAAAAETLTFRYTCARGVEIPAVYVNALDQPGVAVILVEGRLIALEAGPSGSGVRYAWPSDGSGYVWWTKGDEAALYWRNGEIGEETLLLDGCRAG